MKERPIIFTHNIEKILDGSKTQTRRVIKHPEYYGCPTGDCPHWLQTECDAAMAQASCPYGVPGDRLWVRECFCLESCRDVGEYDPPFADGRPIRWHEDDEFGKWWEQPHYRATDPEPGLGCDRPSCDNHDPHVHWRPSIHMPRWASRINLEIVSVRPERLQAITEEDAKAEGCLEESSEGTVLGHGMFTAKLDFYMLWDSINAKRQPWVRNPWVWRIDFERLIGEPSRRMDGQMVREVPEATK